MVIDCRETNRCHHGPHAALGTAASLADQSFSPSSLRPAGASEDASIWGGGGVDDQAALVVGTNAQRWVMVLPLCGVRGAFPLDPSQGRHADLARGDMRGAVRSWIIKRRVSYVHLVVAETKIGMLGSRAVARQAPSAARIRVLTRLLQLCSEHNVLWSVEARDDLPILLWGPLLRRIRSGAVCCVRGIGFYGAKTCIWSNADGFSYDDVVPSAAAFGWSFAWA